MSFAITIAAPGPSRWPTATRGRSPSRPPMWPMRGKGAGGSTSPRHGPCRWHGFRPSSGVTCFALLSGGGQQGPVLAAAGAHVTVYDNCPAQLQRDRDVAAREGLVLHTVEGDMRDLRDLESSSFDLIVHPVSNTFVPDVLPVWHEAFRVLRPGGALLSGFDNPAVHLFDEAAYWQGRLEVVHSLPFRCGAPIPR